MNPQPKTTNQKSHSPKERISPPEFPPPHDPESSPPHTERTYGRDKDGRNLSPSATLHPTPKPANQKKKDLLGLTSLTAFSSPLTSSNRIFFFLRSLSKALRCEYESPGSRFPFCIESSSQSSVTIWTALPRLSAVLTIHPHTHIISANPFPPHHTQSSKASRYSPNEPIRQNSSSEHTTCVTS